jgi:hypothetical protein
LWPNPPKIGASGELASQRAASRAWHGLELLGNGPMCLWSDTVKLAAVMAKLVMTMGEASIM